MTIPTSLLLSLLLPCLAVSACAEEPEWTPGNGENADEGPNNSEGDPQFLDAVQDARDRLFRDERSGNLRLVQFYWGTVSTRSDDELTGIPTSLTFFDPESEDCYVTVTASGRIEASPVTMQTWSQDYYDCSANLPALKSPACTRLPEENGAFIGFESKMWGNNTMGPFEDCTGEPLTVPIEAKIPQAEAPATSKSGCAKFRKSTVHPWAQLRDWSYEHTNNMNNRHDNDRIYKPAGVIWWDRGC